MGLTVSFVISSVIGLVCHRRLRFVSASLTPASRRQDHTTSPSALALFVSSAISVHRIPPRVRDDRDTPLWWDETGGTTVVICVARKPKYFSNRGWTRKSLICRRTIRDDCERVARMSAATCGLPEIPDVASLIRATRAVREGPDEDCLATHPLSDPVKILGHDVPITGRFKI